MAGVAMPITTLKNLETLIRKARLEGFTDNAEVFINCNGELAITFSDGKGYSGWFLNFETGQIIYGD